MSSLFDAGAFSQVKILASYGKIAYDNIIYGKLLEKKGISMDALEECHSRLAKLLGPGAEPIEVLRCAEDHRTYWRPNHVRVLLLAESHVFTTTSELERRVILPNMPGNDIPRRFVRLVYCLGYGENSLLDHPIDNPRNSGTPQFWKIFNSCLNRVQSNSDFATVLGQTPLPARVQNKLALLRRLKATGVWLVDASMAALYLPSRPKPALAILEAALRTSWDSYVGQVVKAASPSHIVCVGRGVARCLGDRLTGLGVPVTAVPQPNARLSSAEHLAAFQHYYDVVRRAGQDIP